MKKRSLVVIILPVILLLSGISIVVSILRSQQNLAPEISKALSTDIKLVTIGDSLSVDPPGSDLYNHYPSLLKSVYNVATSDSYAVGAAQTGSSPSPFKGMRLQYSEDVAGKGYNAIIIMGGVNDVASSVQASTTETNLDWLYSQAKDAGMKVIAIPVLPWGCFSTSSPAKMTTTKEINAWIKSNSKVDFFIDAYGEFNDGSDCLKDTYSLDEVHINRAGHDKLALMIFDQVFQGVSPTPDYMQCGELGCTARGDDAACGWPGSGIECKSGYNNGEGRCEIVCTGDKVKSDICTCSDATPVPTTITPTPTLSATPSPTLTPSPSPLPTPSPTMTNTVTPTPTRTPTPTPTVIITTTVPVTTVIATRTPSPSPTVRISTTVIPKTALNEGQTMIVILGVIFILSGFCLKAVLKQQTY